MRSRCSCHRASAVSESGWPRSGGLPIEMPVVFPQVFELHQFSVTVGESHVDCAGHFLSGSNFAGGAGRAATAMSRDGASSHVIYRDVQWLAHVKVGVGPVGLFRPHVNPILVEKNRGQHRFLNGRLAGEKLTSTGQFSKASRYFDSTG